MNKLISSGHRKGGPPDQYCILEQPDGEKALFITIKYKPPHKSSLDSMIAGLSDRESRPAEDVINKEAEGFEATSKALVAAVITQLFSYMIRKGLRWGYTCTSEANIFLHIPDDPSVVYYHLSIPTLDCQRSDENHEYRTAVAQVSAFVLRAMNAAAPNQLWRDEAKKLPVCLGSVELELPQYFEDGEYVKMLSLSWAGRPLFNLPDQNKKYYYVAQMKAAIGYYHTKSEKGTWH